MTIATHPIHLPVLWIPLGLMAGVAGYFLPPSAPSIIWAWGLLGLAGFFLACYRLHRLSLWVGMWLLVVLLGALASHGQVVQSKQAIIQNPMEFVQLSGKIASIEPRERGIRAVIEHPTVDGLPAEATPQRIRLAFYADTPLLDVGDWLRVRAHLHPLPSPVFPGDMDLARRLYLDGIGGIGFAVGKPQLLPPPEQKAEGLWQKITTVFATWREAAGEAIADALPHPAEASIARALLLGEVGGIARADYDVLRQAGLAHIVAISGFHMVVVAGMSMVLLRRLLALFPYLALHWPLRSISALAAIPLVTAYLLLSGSPPSAERAWVMLLLAMLAVALGREVSPMRLLALAAIALLLVAPAMLFTASLQMSFAAVFALVVLHHYWRPWAPADPDARRLPKGFMLFSRLVEWLAATAMASLVAGLATAPFSLYHFNSISMTGMVANMLVVPLASFWLMPLGMLALVLMPFGWHSLTTWLVGKGVGWMFQIATWCNQNIGWQWQGIEFGSYGLLGIMVAVTGIIFWRRRERWLLLTIALLAPALEHALKPQPIAMMEPKYTLWKTPDGWWMHGASSRGNMVVNRWKDSFQLSGVQTWKTSGDGGRICDAEGCRFSMADGHWVDAPEHAAAIYDSCRLAEENGGWVIETTNMHRCKYVSLLMNHEVMRQRGALLWLVDSPFQQRWLGGTAIAKPVYARPEAMRPWL